jgi:hypothetical protein
MSNRSQMVAKPVPQSQMSKAWSWIASILLVLALAPVYALLVVLYVIPSRRYPLQ